MRACHHASPKKSYQATNAFTLAELLIALAILGVIATFTIPKVLPALQYQRYNSLAKETAASISNAFQQYRLNNVVTGSFTPSALAQYFNYRSLDTSGSLIDNQPTSGSLSCTAPHPCLRLYNGDTLYLSNEQFGTTGTTNAVQLVYDPDSVYSGSTSDSSGKAVSFVLYADGFLTTRGQAKSNTCNISVCYGPNPATDPSWFSWN